MENILISACLMGVNCRYSGVGKNFTQIEELMERFHLVPVCPEIFGGLPTPRQPSEQREGRVITNDGCDVTGAFEKGAAEVLRLARLYNCKYALLKERSPSCGYGQVYDGTFTGTLIPGNGVLAELLSNHGIIIFGEGRIEELLNL